MLECSTGELLGKAAFMHHVDKGRDALNHYVALKGLTVAAAATIEYQCFEAAMHNVTFTPECFGVSRSLERRRI